MTALPEGPNPFALSNWSFTTHGGQRLAIRRVTQHDAGAITNMLTRLSGQTLRRRYLSSHTLPQEAIQREVVRICRGQQDPQIALLAVFPRFEGDEVLAVAELVPDTHDPTTGHLAVVVRDDYQAQGLGMALLRHLLELARVGGLATLQANFLAENRATRRLIDRLGLPYIAWYRRGEIEVRVRLTTLPGTTAVASTDLPYQRAG